MNKEAITPNLKQYSLKAICIIHDTNGAEQIEIAEFVIMDELLTSCSHTNNMYRMYLLDKDKEAQQPKKIRKRKAPQEELTAAKKSKKDLEVRAQKLGESADKKAKETQKKTDVATMKTLMIESNVSRKKEEIMKTNVSEQEEEIKEVEKKSNTCQLSRNTFLDQLSITKCGVKG